MICRMATVLLLLVLSVGAVSSAPITSDDVRIIDGDTIRLHHQKPDIRLVGFNAPETRRAMCEAERDLGDKATARLRKLVRSNKLDFEFVACACQQPPPIHANAEPQLCAKRLASGVRAFSKARSARSARRRYVSAGCMIRANIRSKRSVVRYGAAAGLKKRIRVQVVQYGGRWMMPPSFDR